MSALVARDSLVLCTLLFTIARAAPALAQGNDAALATELFNAGRDLMNQGDYTAACPKFAQSARLDAKVGTLARLAECDEKTGRMVSARAHWLQAMNVAQAQGDNRLAHVRAELARVDAVVPKVNVSVAGPVPPGLSLSIDGADAGAASLGLALPVEAGRHTLVVSATGKKPYTITLEPKSDGAVTPVSVPPLEDAPATFVPLVTPADFRVRARSREDGPVPYWTPVRKVGLGVASVGAVGLVVGGLFGVLAKVELDKSNADGCNPANDCGSKSSTAYGERTTAYSDGTIGTVLLIAGGVVAATGVTLLLAPASHEGGPTATASVGPGYLGLDGRF